MAEGLIKKCAKMGLMSSCRETFYNPEWEDEIYCYYHRKVRDGLISPEDHKGFEGLV